MSTTKVKPVAGQHEYNVPGWSAYPVVLSEACAPKGDGQCDGHDYDEDEPCDCPCHVIGTLPPTVPEVKTWHDDLHAGTLDGTEALG